MASKNRNPWIHAAVSRWSRVVTGSATFFICEICGCLTTDGSAIDHFDYHVERGEAPTVSF